ncbi:MAG: YitT family protein, partial [Acidimicrobiia bacterium]
MFGLVLFGIGLAWMVLADLGLAPWEVLHQGISERSGILIGTVGILTGIVVLIAWIPIGERVGLGTILNVAVIGIVIDVTLWILPAEIGATWLRWVAMVGGVALVAIGSGFYIGAGQGPGPRDGLMTGMAARGFPLGLTRTVIELSVLIGGWFLGGTVGIGTVLFAFGVGPSVAYFLPRLTAPAPVAT